MDFFFTDGQFCVYEKLWKKPANLFWNFRGATQLSLGRAVQETKTISKPAGWLSWRLSSQRQKENLDHCTAEDSPLIA